MLVLHCPGNLIGPSWDKIGLISDPCRVYFWCNRNRVCCWKLSLKSAWRKLQLGDVCRTVGKVWWWPKLVSCDNRGLPTAGLSLTVSSYPCQTFRETKSITNPCQSHNYMRLETGRASDTSCIDSADLRCCQLTSLKDTQSLFVYYQFHVIFSSLDYVISNDWIISK
jgi:hypothetical protein